MGYLTTSAMREYQEQLQKLEVQSADMKQKLRGDYLVKERMYGRAVSEYREILKRKNPGKLGVQFYAAIWNNLGAAYAGMLDFRRAGGLFSGGISSHPDEGDIPQVYQHPSAVFVRGGLSEAARRAEGRSVSGTENSGVQCKNVYIRGVSGGKGTHAQERSERSRKGSEGAVLQKYKNMRLAYRERIMYTLGVCKRKQDSSD